MYYEQNDTASFLANIDIISNNNPINNVDESQRDEIIIAKQKVHAFQKSRRDDIIVEDRIVVALKQL